jgi:hypothetical protein
VLANIARYTEIVENICCLSKNIRNKYYGC